MTPMDPETKNWQTVEFRCMVQDILGNEIYQDHDSEKFGDRTIFYCITVPGENDWVRSCPKGSKNEFMTNNEQTQTLPTTKPPTTTSSDSNGTNNSNHSSSDNSLSEREKIMRLSSYLVNWSFPIPGNGKNRSCLIKVYDIKLVEYLRVNDILQVTGVVEPADFEDDSTLLTNKPATELPNGQAQSDTNGTSSNVNGTTAHDDFFEPAHDFPHRLVPRVHVRKLKKVKHINPLLPDIITRDQIDLTAVKLARARLSTILKQLLGGDELSVEFLIMSLISKIHRRKDLCNLGQFTIGLTGFKPEMKFLVEKLYEIITKITTHSHYIEMSIANLNNLRFTPKKDHQNNKMIAGTLQLPDGLYLLLNETCLTEGQLTAQGTQNVGTLNNIIRWQRHSYNFKFHSVEIDTDLKILVISESKCLLPITFSVPIQNNDPETINSMKEACESVDGFLTEELLNMFRYYITALLDVPEYTLPDDVKTYIEKDFVEWRKEADANNTSLPSDDTLSSLLTMARYLTISRGEVTLTKEIWKEVRQMESIRQSRIRSN